MSPVFTRLQTSARFIFLKWRIVPSLKSIALKWLCVLVNPLSALYWPTLGRSSPVNAFVYFRFRFIWSTSALSKAYSTAMFAALTAWAGSPVCSVVAWKLVDRQAWNIPRDSSLRNTLNHTTWMWAWLPLCVIIAGEIFVDHVKICNPTIFRCDNYFPIYSTTVQCTKPLCLAFNKHAEHCIHVPLLAWRYLEE